MASSDILVNLDMKTMAIAGTCGVICLIAVEHYGRRNMWVWRPSYLFQSMANGSKFIWRRAGETIAKCSSFLTQIEYKEILRTVEELARPLIQLVGSPMNIVTGYFNEARTKNPYLVCVGSIIMSLVLGYGIYKFCPLIVTDKMYNWATQYISNPISVVNIVPLLVVMLGCYKLSNQSVYGTKKNNTVNE